MSVLGIIGMIAGLWMFCGAVGIVLQGIAARWLEDLTVEGYEAFVFFGPFLILIVVGVSVVAICKSLGFKRIVRSLYKIGRGAA